MTGTLCVAAIALAQASGISIDAAEVSAEAKAAVEKAITEMGCSLDVSHARGEDYSFYSMVCPARPHPL